MRVSICTSVLNQSDFLKRNIESIIAQTFTDWEHIIVDDGSTEDIKSLVESYNDPRIIYVRQDNQGFQSGYNNALKLAKGEYVELLSADEFIWDKKLEVQVEWMDKHPEIGCTWGLPTPDTGKPWILGKGEAWEQYQWRAHNRSQYGWIRTLMSMENTAIGGASMLMRRECYEAIGGFDPQFNALSDLEWFVRFFHKFHGWVLPYRFADATHSPDSQGKKSNFQDELKLLHIKHKLLLPPDEGRVTVLIPVYNMAKLIPKALESLKSQTFRNFEVLVIDDCSTDNLSEVMIPYLDDGMGWEKEADWQNKMRVTFMKMEENSGVRKVLNAAIALCETEFFVSLAADDWIEPDYLEKALKEFKSDPYLEFVASQTDFVDEEGVPLKPNSNDVQNIEKAYNKSRDNWLGRLYHGNVYFGVGMYRTYALKEVGGFDTEAGVLTDYDMYLKLLQRENIKIIEENLTHTRIHSGNASIGPNKFTPEWLRNKYSEIRKRYFPPRQKVIFATPFYEMKAFSPYVHSMFYTIRQLQAMNIWAEFWDLSGDSYVDRAKNTLFNKFLEDPDATDLFMIDSDMQWNPQSVITMISLPDDIVIGSYPQKNSWGKWTSVPKMQKNGDGGYHPIGRQLPDGSALIQSEYLSGGFMRVKRSVLERYKEKFTEDAYQDPSADPSNPERKYTNFFICEVKDGLRWGEDRFFGKRLDQLGITTMIYPNIDFTHYGVKGWGGNFDKWLRDPKLQTPPDGQNSNQERIS
jgi:glycosyltransferase involved in cell wall biosynthesis